MHTPVDVTERALKVVAEHDVDGVVAIGGGSATGLAKAISLHTDLPQLIVPTTYAGSELTAVLGETADGRKTTQRLRRSGPGPSSTTSGSRSNCPSPSRRPAGSTHSPTPSKPATPRTPTR